MFETLLQIFFPITCLLCKNSERNYLCDHCDRKLPRREQACLICQRKSAIGTTCFTCINATIPDGFYAPYTYRSGLKTIINRAKRSDSERVFENLGSRLAASLPEMNLTDYVLTAIPLHKSKYRARGFNQSEVLANQISLRTNLRYERLLSRTKKTQEQKKLSLKARNENLKDAFKVTKSNLNGLKILLIDDIVTTGASTLSATRVLKAAGAKKVIILALASDR